MRAVQLIAATLLFASCATDEEAPPVDQETPGGELGLGDVSAADMKADGEWGSALDCKPLPNLPPLANPKITLSIDGLTLRLTDATSGFDKTYPVGPGSIETDPTQPSFMESLSYYPIYRTGRKDFEITPSTIQPCKTWWTDGATGERIPVFAGLPFLSFYGNYAIHGPVDNYRAPNGGTLRRGYVSHGCFRMEAADILEVYARIKGVAKVPVRLQREPEKTVEGTRVDTKKFVGSTCTQNTDCNFTGGFCASNPYTGAGFCSARCTQFCSDRGGTNTFCVTDPTDTTKGMCVPKVQATNFQCRPYDHMKVAAGTPRFNQPATIADVCTPGSGGWVGDHCRANTDCGNGTTCAGATAAKAGVCTMACNSVCADMPGYADTFCAAGSSLASGGTCLRQCTPGSNASECPADMRCGQLSRPSSTVKKNVCLPR